MSAAGSDVCCTFVSVCYTRPCSTFDRLVDGSRNIIVRFDKEYSYGDEHDAWKDFAKTVGESSADVLVADVGVSGQCCALPHELLRAHALLHRLRGPRSKRAQLSTLRQSTVTRTTATSLSASTSSLMTSRHTASGLRALRRMQAQFPTPTRRRRTRSCASSRKKRVPGSDLPARLRRWTRLPRSS